MFSTLSKTNIITLSIFDLLSANALNFVLSKKLFFGKVIKGRREFRVDDLVEVMTRKWGYRDFIGSLSDILLCLILNLVDP